MYYGVIKDTTRVIHNSNDIEEIKRNISLANITNYEIISEKDYKNRLLLEKANAKKEPTTEELILNEIAEIKLEIMQLKEGK